MSANNLLKTVMLVFLMLPATHSIAAINGCDIDSYSIYVAKRKPIKVIVYYDLLAHICPGGIRFAGGAGGVPIHPMATLFAYNAHTGERVATGFTLAAYWNQRAEVQKAPEAGFDGFEFHKSYYIVLSYRDETGMLREADRTGIFTINPF